MSDQAQTVPGEFERIGPYKLLRTLGEGGMGVVYEAEQTEPVQRRVAIKLIRGALGFDEFIARFEAERQALAVMQHPNIATVLEAGATDSGIPYLVLEYVDGVSITEYCDARRLTVEQRLRLFIPVCRAIQHAHQKGVIHRDLKPSNVMVTEQAGTPEPKVIDFGLAKAMDMRLTDRSIATAHGLVVGTPAYMSPEQAEGTNLDIDTRTDIYALGVMLYELLAGQLPLDPDELGLLPFIARLVSHTSNPPSPSSRISRADASATEVAQRRGTEFRALRRQLKGDLDCIVMQAIAPERERRYQTANGLAMDLIRYLEEEPVVARPASTTYRLGKFARRHRALVAGGGMTLLALVAGLIGTAQGLLRANRERDRTQALNEYLVQEILSAPDPSVDGAEVKVVDVLDRASERVGETFGDQPDLEADIRITLSTTYTGLGQFAKAEDHARAALDLRTELYGGDAVATLEALHSLGKSRVGQDAFDDAIEILSAAAEGRRRELGAEHPETLETLPDLAAAYARSGRFEEAIALEREVLEARRRVLGPEADETLFAMVSLGATLSQVGETKEAEELYLAVYERFDATGDPDIWFIGALNGLSIVYNTLGDSEKAEAYGRQAWEASKTLYGEGHPETAVALVLISNALAQARRWEDAEPLRRQVVDIYRDRLGDEHQWTMTAVHNLAGTIAQLDQAQEAERLHLENLANRRRLLGEKSPAAAESLSGLAIVYNITNRWSLAIETLTEAIEIYRNTFGDGHPDVATNLFNLSAAYNDAGDYANAAKILRELLEIDKRALGPTHRWVLIDYRDLIRILIRGGDPDEAEAVARERLEHTSSGLAADDPLHLESLTLLGMCLTERGEYEEAERRLLKGHAGLTETPDVEDERIRDSLEYLVRLYEAWGRPEAATRYRAELDAR